MIKVIKTKYECADCAERKETFTPLFELSKGIQLQVPPSCLCCGEKFIILDVGVCEFVEKK